jgi:hypothetical protein
MIRSHTTTGTRLSISEVHRRPRFASRGEFSLFSAASQPLPRHSLSRWLRSLRRLLMVSLLLALLFAIATRHLKVRSAMKKARWEALLAERALTDSDFDLATSNASKWTKLWPPRSTTSPQKGAALPTTHAYNENGLLVSGDGASRHPIMELIEKGERDWKALKARQSKNLTDVVFEYKRRHKRNPPIGFDAWCAWSLPRRQLTNALAGGRSSRIMAA